MAITASSLDRCPGCGALDIVTHGEQVECLHCKQALRLADLVVCPQCGDVLPSAAAAGRHCAPTPQAAQPDAAEGPRGVGGWLLLLAVSLAAVGPVTFLVELIRFVSLVGEVASAPGLRAFSLFSFGGDAVITVVLATAGIQILARRPGAIRFCRRSLLLAPAIACAQLGAGFLLLEGDVLQAALPSAALGTARTGLLALAWLAYLQTSRRVRNTFAG